MKFNTLWLMLLFLFLFTGGWFLLMPLFLMIIVFFGGIFLAGTSARVLMKAPRQIWGILSDARVRANLALCHAACNVLRQSGWPKLTGTASATGFFIGGIDDESSVYEASVQALARLKNGEKSLRILPESPLFRIAVMCLSALPLTALLAAAGSANALSAAAAVILSWVIAPYISPFLQGAVLSAGSAAILQVQGAVFRELTMTAWGGRFSSAERGVEVPTAAENVIEAEIVED